MRIDQLAYQTYGEITDDNLNALWWANGHQIDWRTLDIPLDSAILPPGGRDAFPYANTHKVEIPALNRAGTASTDETTGGIASPGDAILQAARNRLLTAQGSRVLRMQYGAQFRPGRGPGVAPAAEAEVRRALAPDSDWYVIVRLASERDDPLLHLYIDLRGPANTVVSMTLDVLL